MITQPNRESMTSRRVVLLSSALLLAPGALPAAASFQFLPVRAGQSIGHDDAACLCGMAFALA